MTTNQNIIGYVVLDRVTKALDWDGELHATTADAIRSLTGKAGMYCLTLAEESENKWHWEKHYMLGAVTA